MNPDKYILNSNVQAFLRAIRIGEGTSDVDGYRRLVGGGEFDSYQDHPNKKIHLDHLNINSTAAGAYQIIHLTWVGLKSQYDLPDFSPDSQDRAAIGLISECDALRDIVAGKFAIAVQKCSKEWASLPGSTAGQRIEDFEKVRQVYLDNGGTEAV